MIETVKFRCGIPEKVTIYDDDIRLYIEDAKEDMIMSGVPPDIIEAKDSRVTTAVTLYVKAHIGSDRSDTERYLGLYRQKVFRLTLEEGGS